MFGRAGLSMGDLFGVAEEADRSDLTGSASRFGIR